LIEEVDFSLFSMPDNQYNKSSKKKMDYSCESHAFRWNIKIDDENMQNACDFEHTSIFYVQIIVNILSTITFRDVSRTAVLFNLEM
jgi:hypothetical protein